MALAIFLNRRAGCWMKSRHLSVGRFCFCLSFYILVTSFSSVFADTLLPTPTPDASPVITATISADELSCDYMTDLVVQVLTAANVNNYFNVVSFLVVVGYAVSIVFRRGRSKSPKETEND